MIQHFLSHWLGLDNPSGAIYLFYSGSGSKLLALGIFATWYHKHNCHVDGCKRLSKHSGVYCKRHLKVIKGD